MEVGAVKQAFNNELILLKKKLNQAKIQLIHKLTRKAKTLVEKKAPEPLQEKFKRKAESAVKEVLIIKKIKARDIGRFIITHTKQLQEHLNKPEVDQDKACARLLLHKSLADKYKYIRNKFSHVPINDLFMSRQERRKLKKEAKELQKNKNKAKREKRDAKNKVVNAEGDWNVEDVKTDDLKEELENKSNLEESDDDQNSDDDKQGSDDENSSDDNQLEVNSEYDSNEDDADAVDIPNIAPKSIIETSKTKNKALPVNKGSESEDSENDRNSNADDSNSEDDAENDIDDVSLNEIPKTGIKSHVSKRKTIPTKKESKPTLPDIGTPVKSEAFELKLGKNKPSVKSEKKHKDNKNKNLKEKIQHNKFKKDSKDVPLTENKVADPFFITSTGENYMSVAEVRPPDEVKDEHRQGNRQVRRARMFGHVPKIKPRSNRQNNFDKQNDFDRRNSSKPNGYQRNKFEGNFKQNDGDPSNFKERNKHTNFKEKSSFEDDGFKNKGIKRTLNEESKPEKLHPSWEAKKKLSGILPFQGKKIVFNDN